jgi:endonuclease I
MAYRDMLVSALVESGKFSKAELLGKDANTLNEMLSNLFPKKRKKNNRKPEIRKRIYLAIIQNWQCYWCKQECREESGHPNTATIEHITPRSKGGSNEMDNLAMACYNCNNRRGNEDWFKFLVFSCSPSQASEKT